MSSIHIREISESTLNSLKSRAKRHHRSLQKEIVKLLEDAAHMNPEEYLSSSDRFHLHFAESVTSTQLNDGDFSREDIYEDAR